MIPWNPRSVPCFSRNIPLASEAPPLSSKELSTFPWNHYKLLGKQEIVFTVRVARSVAPRLKTNRKALLSRQLTTHTPESRQAPNKRHTYFRAISGRQNRPRNARRVCMILFPYHVFVDSDSRVSTLLSSAFPPPTICFESSRNVWIVSGISATGYGSSGR